MPAARPRPPSLPRPPRGAALVALVALAAAAAAGCARKGAAPGSGPAAAAPAAQAPAPSGARPAAAPAAVPTRPPAAAATGTAPAAAAPSSAQPSAPTGAAEPPAALAAPELTMEQMQRRSPSAALVELFNAACAEPARAAVRRAARRLEFTPVVAAGAPRERPGGGAAASAAPPGGGEAWRGPEEVGGAVLVWDDAASTCELRAEGVNLLLVEAAFSRLPQVLEEEGSSVMRLAPPATPAGGVRTRQMLLVQPGPLGRPERARVLRLGHRIGGPSGGGAAAGPDGGDAVTLSARAVSAPR